MSLDPTPEAVDRLLEAWARGDADALHQLIELLYVELRRVARAYMRGERPGHSLQTTALINEVYIRLAAQRRPNARSRAHFFGISAQLMRRILVDHARARQYAKRGAGLRSVPLEEAILISAEHGPNVLALDEALERLARLDGRKARVVELRYFGGMTVEESADVLGVSAITVARDWHLARAWLKRELQK